MVKKAVDNHGIRKLTPVQHVRAKEMYFGSRSLHTQSILQFVDGKLKLVEETWTPAVNTALREILDNITDEFSFGVGDSINVTFNPQTFEFSCEDNGRGIPISLSDEYVNGKRVHLATLVLSQIMTGRNFDDRGEVAGTNGIGAAGVNFSSEYFEVVIYRDHKIFKQRFEESPVGFVEELKIGDVVIKDTMSSKTGTKITFKLSERVFPVMVLSENFVKSRLTEIAICNPQYHVTYNGEKIKVKPLPEQNLFPNEKPIKININEPGFNSTFYIAPNFLEEGKHEHSIINNIVAFQGGTVMDTFKKYFFSNLLSALERESKRRKLSPNMSDITEKTLVYNITKMKAPNFDSQSKTRLINENVIPIIKKYLDNEELYKDIIKKNKEWIDDIFDRCAKRTQKKDAADISKLAKKNLRTKVPGLMDANSVKRSDCILFLAEGLCMSENTNIHVLENGELTNKTARDIEVGDIVLSHKHNYKYVTGKTSKVSVGNKIKTKFGEEIFSSEHKLLTYNKLTAEFKFLEVSNIDKNIHQLVRSKVVESTGIIEIKSNEPIEDEKYDRKIVYGNGAFELCTKNHSYAVFDMEEASFRMVESSLIDCKKHAMVLKVQEKNA